MTDTTAPVTEWKNLFGVCACLGEDFGFDPLWLRLALAAGLLFSPAAVVAVYLGLGVAVLVSRLAIPTRWRFTAATS